MTVERDQEFHGPCWSETRPGLYLVVDEDDCCECWYVDSYRRVRLTGWDPGREPIGDDTWTSGAPTFLDASVQDDLPAVEEVEVIVDTDYAYESLRGQLESAEAFAALEAESAEEIARLTQERELERSRWREESERRRQAFLADVKSSHDRVREQVSTRRRRQHETRHSGDLDTCPICEALDDPQFHSDWGSIHELDEVKFRWLSLGRSKEEALRWAALGDNRLYPQGLGNRSDSPLKLSQAIELTENGMSIEQAEAMQQLPSFSKDADWHRYLPTFDYDLVIGKNDRSKRRKVNSLAASLGRAKNETLLAERTGRLVDALFDQGHSYASRPSGRGVEINGAHYQVVWIGVAKYRTVNTEAVSSIEPGLALLRNDAVLHIGFLDREHFDELYRPSKYRYRTPVSRAEVFNSKVRLGDWRARYRYAADWFGDDLRMASLPDLERFASEASTLVRELFTVDGNDQTARSLTAVRSGVDAWWVRSEILAHLTGDLLEERYGTEPIVAAALSLADDKEWWKWTTFYETMTDDTRDAYLNRLSGQQDIGFRESLNDSGWKEIVRRLEHRASQ
jgi:hypothetical protein